MKTFGPFDGRRVSLAESKLAFDPTRRTDIYFSRTLQVLRESNLNPWVRGQMFLRNPGRKDGILGGVYDVIGCFSKFAPNFFKNGGRIWSLPEGAGFADTETVMVIEGRAQDFVELETIYLGLLSAGTSWASWGSDVIDLPAVTRRVKAMRSHLKRSLDPTRKLVFFGMRHYHPNAIRVLTEAAFAAGDDILCSTPLMGEVHDQNAVGTVPHFLENVVCYYVGAERAVSHTMKLFDTVVDSSVNRINLVDWRNREIDDARASIEAVANLNGFRLDTAGENVCQGAIGERSGEVFDSWLKRGLYLPNASDPISRFWLGRGVTVSAAKALIDATQPLKASLRKPFLTSGFSDPRKVEAFVDAEYLLGGEAIFSGIGFGEITDDARSFAKLDLIAIGEDPGTMRRIHKAGRPPKPSSRLLPAAGSFSSDREQPIFGENTSFGELIAA